MFTGIVKGKGTVRSAAPSDGGAVLTVDCSALRRSVEVGGSVAVNGVCLTAARVVSGAVVSFDVIPETVRRTTLGLLRTGDRVNLEPSLRVGDPLDGHWMQGHADGTGVIARIVTQGDELLMEVKVDAEIAGQLVFKGSVTLDGVSLTISELSETGFSVCLIPHTREVTVLGEKKVGDRVNIEADIIGKYVRRTLEGYERDGLPAL
jgi:riboflavin synthase